MARPVSHLVLLLLIVPALIATSATGHGRGDDNLRDACRVTLHRSLCMHSLASFAHPAGRSPRLWARAAVSVTLAESERVQEYLARIKNHGRRGRGRARAALLDCTECFGDAVGQLHGALGELRRLKRGGTFAYQMSNVETWVSSALTNQDTCLDGLRRLEGRQVDMIRSKVLNTTYFTSNALALVNKLASSGGRE